MAIFGVKKCTFLKFEKSRIKLEKKAELRMEFRETFWTLIFGREVKVTRFWSKSGPGDATFFSGQKIKLVFIGLKTSVKCGELACFWTQKHPILRTENNFMPK